MNFWGRESCIIKKNSGNYEAKIIKRSIFDYGGIVEICLWAMPRLNFSAILFFEDSLNWDWDFWNSLD